VSHLPFAHRGSHARPDRVEDVADRRVRQAPSLLALVAQPADELGDVGRGDLRQPSSPPVVEERVGELVEQPSVVVAGRLAEAAAAVPLVALYPVNRVVAEPLATEGVELAPGDVGSTGSLDLPGLVQRPCGLFALPAVGVAVDDDVPRPPAEDAGGLGLD